MFVCIDKCVYVQEPATVLLSYMNMLPAAIARPRAPTYDATLERAMNIPSAALTSSPLTSPSRSAESFTPRAPAAFAGEVIFGRRGGCGVRREVE